MEFRKGTTAKVAEITAESETLALLKHLKSRMKAIGLKWGRREVDWDEYETILRGPDGRVIWSEGSTTAWLLGEDSFWFIVKPGTSEPITIPPPYFTPEQVKYVNELVGKEILTQLY